MAWRSAGSLTRSLSRVSSVVLRRRCPASVRRKLPLATSHAASPSPIQELGCTTLILPSNGVAPAARFTSHLSVNPWAFSELSHGTFRCACLEC